MHYMQSLYVDGIINRQLLLSRNSGQTAIIIISFTYFIRKLYLKAHFMFVFTTRLAQTIPYKAHLHSDLKVKYEILRQRD